MQPQNWNMASQDWRGNFLWTLAMCLFHTKPQRRLRIYPVPVSCFNDDANTFRLQAIFILQVEPSKLCMPTCQMQVAPKISMWWEHIFISGQRYILKSLTSKMSIKTPGPLCPLGPLLTRMIGNTPNAQNLGGSQFETCLCFFSRKSSSPGCICRVMCHIVICSMSIYIYICVCKNVIFHVICTDASRVMKANSPTFQDHLVDQHPRISANPATQSVSNTWPQHIFPCKLTICLFHAKVL